MIQRAKFTTPLPRDIRTEMNMELTSDGMLCLSKESRNVVRTLVARAYERGYEDGGLAVGDDLRTDHQIEQEREGPVRYFE